MADQLAGQVALITGAGRGIGRAIALAFAEAGAHLGLIARTQAQLDGVAREIEAGGGTCHVQAADVSEPKSLRDAIERLESSFGPPDILVNNAGILGPIGPFEHTDPTAWWHVAEVNLHGPMIACHALVPAMLARGSGRIINVVTGAAPFAYFSAYAASKTALVRFSEFLSAEICSGGVAVFSMAPGTVRTAMSEHSMTSEEGRTWIPWFRRIFDEGLDLPMERPVQLALALASGGYDSLSGLTLTPLDDLDAIRGQLSEVGTQKLYSLRLRTLPNPELERIQVVRDAGEKGDVPALELDWTFNAERRRLYDAWIDAGAWASWFIPEGGPANWNQPPVVEPRAGGRISIDIASEGQDFLLEGSFSELVEGHRLAFTWTWGSDSPLGAPGNTRVVVVFEGDSGSARIHLHQANFPNLASREAHERGWIRCFRGLADLIEPQTRQEGGRAKQPSRSAD